MKNKKGFTLVEIVMVIALLALLIVVVVPNLLKSLKNANSGSFYNDVLYIYVSSLETYAINSVNNPLAAK